MQTGATPPTESDEQARSTHTPALTYACGYRLRGLAPESSCPECGRAIAEAIAGHEEGKSLRAALGCVSTLAVMSLLVLFLINVIVMGPWSGGIHSDAQAFVVLWLSLGFVFLVYSALLAPARRTHRVPALHWIAGLAGLVLCVLLAGANYVLMLIIVSTV